MRLAMVSEHASPLAAAGDRADSGGQNVHVASLACELGRRGVEVVVHTRRDDPELPRRVELAPYVAVDHVAAGPPEHVFRDDLLPYMDEFAADLYRVWQEEPPDLVHAHHWMSGLAALGAARPLGIPVVHTFHALGTVKRRHQGSKDTSPPERIAEETALVQAVDLIVAESSDEVFELVQLGAPLGKVTVVPSGVDVDLFAPDGPAERRTPGVDRLVVVSRIVERKGIGDAVAALAEIPGAELVVAGAGDEEEERRLRRLAREAGVADRVSFRGKLGRSEVPSLLRSADVVLCLPWYEPFGIVPVEAMACGVPVVGSAVGGLLDTVADGVTGVHVPPRSPTDVAAAVRRLLADPALRRRMGEAGARRARERYSWERVADAHLDAYAPLVERTAIAAQGELS